MNAAAPTPVLEAAERTALQRRVVQALSAHLPAHALLWQAEDTVPVVDEAVE